MKRLLPLLPLLFATPAAAQEAEKPTPASVVAAAPARDWEAIDPADLLVMTLAPDAKGGPRQVVIQLVPPPLSLPWVANVRALARAHWWDGTTVYRVVDNWVAQWGDGEDEGRVAKPLPQGLQVGTESQYEADLGLTTRDVRLEEGLTGWPGRGNLDDAYAETAMFWKNWPLGMRRNVLDVRRLLAWPVHCYASVGVARNLSPDTGTGAELYAVIGHAPRALDRNIAVVGRVIEGIEHLSTLPRGKGEAGVYDDPALRVPIVSVRLGSDIAEPPRFEILASDRPSFVTYAAVRASRNDSFYRVPAGGVDICNVQVPVRRVAAPAAVGR